MQVVNIAALERDYNTRADAAAALLAKTAKECQAHEEKDKDGKVIAQGRLMSADEKKAIQAIIDDANAIKAKISEAKGEANLQAEIEKLTAGMNRADAEEVRRDVRKSLGQQWVESDAGQYFLKKRHQGTRNWASPVAELYDPIRATTLTEDPASGG